MIKKSADKGKIELLVHLQFIRSTNAFMTTSHSCIPTTKFSGIIDFFNRHFQHIKFDLTLFMFVHCYLI